MNYAAMLFMDHGDRVEISSAGLLFVCAEFLRDPESTEETVRKARHFIDGTLDLARNAGFAQGDMLKARLMRCDTSRATVSFAQQACIAAGQRRVMALFRSMEQEADNALA